MQERERHARMREDVRDQYISLMSLTLCKRNSLRGHSSVTETLMGREGDTLQGCACHPGPPSGAPVKRGDHIPEAH